MIFKNASRYHDFATPVVVLDNIQALFPNIQKGSNNSNQMPQDQQGDILKTSLLSPLLTKYLDKNQIKFIGIARHFSQVDNQLLEIGYLDEIIEVRGPTKDDRCKIF